MKTHRVQREAGKKDTSAQAGMNPENAEGKPREPIPLALRAIDGLDLFRLRMNEAGALVLLLAARIQADAKNNAGWEPFDGSPDFAEGIFGLAIEALENLSYTTDAFNPLVAVLHKINAGGARADLQTEQALLWEYETAWEKAEHYPWEKANAAMRDTLMLMASTLSDRTRNCSGYFAAEHMKENLRTAEKAFWAAMVALLKIAHEAKCGDASKRKADA